MKPNVMLFLHLELFIMHTPATGTTKSGFVSIVNDILEAFPAKLFKNTDALRFIHPFRPCSNICPELSVYKRPL